jgi:hypothetical protein
MGEPIACANSPYPAILAANRLSGKVTARLMISPLTLTPADRSWYPFNMATDTSPATLTEAELLHQYLGRRLANGGRKESLDQLLADFAEYRRELERLRAMLQEAVESSARGESAQLDVEDVIRRGRARMAAEGIVD